mmetsp:Transcript_6173/g.14337  ORF Transcript_6173/g.14337 Transcript_6173/m.14337 type:complete len:675 (+) Transcript_6173:55-2079(+)
MTVDVKKDEEVKDEEKTDVKEEVVERQRVLFTADAEGSWPKLFNQVSAMQKKVGNFDVLLAVGSFLPVMGTPGAAAAGATLAEYVKGQKKAPIDTYFIDSTSGAFLQASPNGKQICERVHFLGGFGVKEIGSLRVAYLSGRYDREIYSASKADAAGAAFVGAAYTPQAVEGLIRLAREQGGPIDVLLTSEWPKGLEAKMDDADAPRDPDGVPIPWEDISSQPIADLVLALEPRYHIFGSGDLFYQRPPFQTLRGGHVCRCIGLGRVGSKGKDRRWLHGLELCPAKTMPQAVLMQRPENTSPCPFAARVPSAVAGVGGGGVKRELEAEEDKKMDQKGELIPDQVFLGKLPRNITEERLAKAFRACGKIERIHLAREEKEEGKPCKGFGWITFSSPEEAEAACDLSEMLEVNGKKIVVSIARAKAGKEGGPGKKRKIEIKVEPHSDCWFCLVNPKVEKHMIVTASTEVYVATTRGPITPSHVMVLPVKHAPCFPACPAELKAAIQSHMEAIRKMCQAAGQECIIWERWIPMGLSAANHMQIQVLPIDQTSAHRAREVLQTTVREVLPKGKLRRIQAFSDVADAINDNTETPYIYFEIPGDNSAKGRGVERYVYPQVEEASKIPLNFGRQVACNLLGLEDKVDWRACSDDRETEKDLAATFRQQYLTFAPGKKPKKK